MVWRGGKQIGGRGRREQKEERERGREGGREKGKHGALAFFVGFGNDTLETGIPVAKEDPLQWNEKRKGRQ
jgi:hypothetical protein